MTAFDVIVPLLALAVAGAGAVILRREGKKLDQDTAHHPAE